MAKVWNITCKLCTHEVTDDRDWVRDQSGASYHKKCYDTAIRLMAHCIAQHQQRKPPPEEVPDDPDDYETERRSPAVGYTADMLRRRSDK